MRSGSRSDAISGRVASGAETEGDKMGDTGANTTGESHIEARGVTVVFGGSDAGIFTMHGLYGGGRGVRPQCLFGGCSIFFVFNFFPYKLILLKANSAAIDGFVIAFK